MNRIFFYFVALFKDLAILIFWSLYSCREVDEILPQATSNGSDTMIDYLIYAQPIDDEYLIERYVAHKWGINYVIIAGCDVTDEILDTINTNNDSVNKIIVQKYGTEWRAKFDSDINLETQNRHIADSVLLSKYLNT